MTVLVDTIQRELDARRALREHLDQEITQLDRMLEESAGLAQLPAVVPPPAADVVDGDVPGVEIATPDMTGWDEDAIAGRAMVEAIRAEHRA